MTFIERNFTNLAISYLVKASNLERYDSDRERLTEAALDILATLIEDGEEEKDGSELD